MTELRITFSPILPSNVQQLKSLNTVIFPIKYEEKMYTDMIACGEVTQLAYHNGELIGAIGCRLENRGAEGIKMYILTLGVLAPYRGMKVGTRLLQRTLSFLSTNLPEVTQAYLHVHTANQDALDFYQKFGFEVEGRVIEKYYKRLEPPDAVLLVKRLQQ